MYLVIAPCKKEFVRNSFTVGTEKSTVYYNGLWIWLGNGEKGKYAELFCG